MNKKTKKQEQAYIGTRLLQHCAITCFATKRMTGRTRFLYKSLSAFELLDFYSAAPVLFVHGAVASTSIKDSLSLPSPTSG